MLQDHAFQQPTHDALFLFVKGGDGLELQAEIVIEAAFVLAEKENICTDL